MVFPGFLPAPLLFGALIDSTCILWDESCGKRGACLLYDTAAFRYLTYGVGVGVLTFVLSCKAILWYLIRDMTFEDADSGQMMQMKSGEKQSVETSTTDETVKIS